MTEQARLYASTHDGILVLQSTAQGWTEAGRLPGVESKGPAGSTRHPERVYVADQKSGVWGTEDAGKSWTKLMDGSVWSVAVDPNDDDVVYAGTAPVRLYRSEDRGKTWEELTGLQDIPDEVQFNWWYPPPPHLGHVYDIFVHPDDSRTLYLCLEHGGVVRSFDRGATWEDVTEGIDYPDMHEVRSLPGSRTKYFIASARGFFTSEDPAAGWARAQNGCTRDYFLSFIFLPPNPGQDAPTMLVSTADRSPGYWERPEEARSAVFRSEDCAQSWHRVGEGLPDELRPMVNMLVNHPADPNGAFAGLGGLRRPAATSVGTLLVSHDRGDSWDELPVKLPPVSGLWAAPE